MALYDELYALRDHPQARAVKIDEIMQENYVGAIQNLVESITKLGNNGFTQFEDDFLAVFPGAFSQINYEIVGEEDDETAEADEPTTMIELIVWANNSRLFQAAVDRTTPEQRNQLYER